MPKTVNQKIFESMLRHQMFLQRHSAGVSAEILVLLKKSEARIVARLERADLENPEHHRKVLARLRAIIKSGYKTIRERINEEVAALATYEAAFQLDLFRRTVPVVLDYATPSPNQLIAAVRSRPFNGRFLREMTRDLETGAAHRLRDEIRMGYVEGRTTEEIIESVRGTRRLDYGDGILQIGRRAAVTITRTALNHTANTARNLTWEQNSDIIDRVQWAATLDSRTTLICSSRDGKTYPVNRGPRPPAHPSCRSTMVPVVKSWKQLGIRLRDAPPGTRESMNGQIAQTTNYDRFLRGQNVQFQNEFLGRKKATLFRRGELPLDRFVDRQGNTLTLAELKIREAEAWARAGLDD